jgi:hypothetical protein
MQGRLTRTLILIIGVSIGLAAAYFLRDLEIR